MQDFQIAKSIYLKSLDTMKKILDLLDFKFDRRTKEYRFLRSQIMDYTYRNLRKLFKEFSDNKIIKKCSKNHNLRQGFKNCDCGGSGWINN